MVVFFLEKGSEWQQCHSLRAQSQILMLLPLLLAVHVFKNSPKQQNKEKHLNHLQLSDYLCFEDSHLQIDSFNFVPALMMGPAQFF